MADRPDWISDKPVEVDIQSLHSFSQAVQQELDQNVKPNAQVLRTRLGGSAHTDRSFGNDHRYSQGQVIGNYHLDCEVKAQELLDDLQRGLQAIAYAAKSIAQDYTSADELSQMDLNKIGGYFHPTDPSRSMTEQMGLPAPTPDPPPPARGGNRAI
jgi:hypothetical protein